MKAFLGTTILAGMLLAGPSHAAVLVPPQSPVAPDSLALGAGSTLLADIVDSLFVSALGASDFSGTYSTWVYSDTTNTFGAGDLTFIYQFTNSSTSAQDINRVTASSFTGFQTDAGFTSGANDSPDSVDRTTASPVGFNFVSGVLPGATSNLLLVETDATQFVPGNVSFIDDGTSTNPAFAPGVPEPRTWAMMLLGFIMLGVAGVKRRTGRFAL